MKLRLLAIFVVIAAGIVLMTTTLLGNISREQDYQAKLESARKFANNEIPYTAAQRYRAAFNIHLGSEDEYREYLEQTRLLGGDFYETAVKDYVRKFPGSAQAREVLCTYYYDVESFSNLLSCANEAREAGLATEKIRDLYLEVYYSFRYLCSDLEDAQSFLGDSARVKKGGYYGYITSYGDYLIAPLFLDASPLMNESAAVRDEQEWYMINAGGYKIARTNVPVDGLSFPSGDKILAAKNGRYGYTDYGMIIPDELPYDSASNFKNGVAAVCRGGKWALITTEENPITDYIFDDVLLDEYGACINDGVAFAKKSGLYYMYDAKGNQIGDRGFLEAYPFCGDGVAAVRAEDGWQFVNTSNEVVLQGGFDEAKSFSNGLAPVRVGATWGYINSSGEYRIESQFEDCKPFTSNGIAAVKESGNWNYIKLLAYY